MAPLELQKMIESESWDTVLPVAKKYVMDHPLDPVGHWLLGKVYSLVPISPTTMVYEEYQLALGLVAKEEDIGELAATMTLEEFKLTAYKESAYALIGWLVRARQLNTPVPLVLPRLRQARDIVGLGLAIDPTDEELVKLRDRIDWYLERDGSPDNVGLFPDQPISFSG